MKTVRLGHPFSLVMSLLAIAAASPAKSQPITPANDSTGTTVTPQGNQFNIEGGTRSGANLFHSFDQFNLNSGQTANFLTTPDTSNILGRVTGGNASYVNGLIQVIGGNSNLFLINPAGIMFGPNASLNIPASFSVTTATGIGFDNNNFWFQAMGTNDYSNLVGNPSGYRFNVSNPGAIVNEGNLTLNPGENLTLLGGTVINTGELSTAGGNITIAAVEGGSTLRISQPGNLLSLEVNPVEDNDITPLSLPGLLTGGEIIQATSVTVNENGDVVLTDSNTVVADVPGTAIATGGIDVSGSEDVGGLVNVLGDRVALIDTNINADGLNSGGTVLIGGESQESSTVFNSQETFVNSGSIISANAIENGDGGNVTIWSDGTTNFAGNISAKGGEFSGDGGLVEVTGKQQLIFDGSVDVTAALGEDGTILLQPESVAIGEPENSDNSQIVENDTEEETTEAEDSETTETEAPTDIFAQDENADVTINAENIGQLSGNVILEADNDITINEKIETDSSVEIKAGRSININADIDTSVGNGNIDILGNNDEMNAANRSEGAASINQLDGTTLNAGSGTINIELGNLGEVGDINLANLTTTGQVLVNANGGNIARVSDSSIINAGSALFQTFGSGGIGLTGAPLQLNVGNLEAVSGSGGVFFDVGDVNIGGVSEDVNGIVTAGGDIEIKSDGNVTLTETISTIETVKNNSEVEATENTEVTDTGGAINIEATGNIVATGSGIKGGGESVSLSATNIRINDEFEETSGDADVKLAATNDITVEDIEDDVLEFLPGEGEIEFRADVDGDGLGVVEMLDNEADVGGDPNTFTNGADTIKTNGRNLNIAGAEIILGNIDTSWLPVFSGGELLATIDVDEGGPIPPEIEDKSGLIIAESVDYSDIEFDSEGNVIIDGKSYYQAEIEGKDYFVPTTTTLNDTATFTFTVDNNLGNVENLDVRFSVEHPFISNLEVNLESPQGQEVTLFASVGGSGQNFQNTVLDDNASRSIDSGSAPFNDTYRPQGSLANFNGEKPNGTWTLKVTDTEPQFASGTLYRAGDTAPWGTAVGTQLLLRTPTTLVSGGGNGGRVNLEATHGNINVGNIRSLSETGNGGRINLKANHNIMTRLINSSSIQGIGGDVNLNAISGNIDTISLDTSSFDGDGGNVKIKGVGDITTAEINSNSGEFFVNELGLTESVGGSGNAGNISIESTAGSIYTNTGSLFARSVLANGGDITISTQKGDITTESLDSSSNSSFEEGNGNGGNITVLTQSGDINTASLNSFSDSRFGQGNGNGGNITVSTQSGDITTEWINSSGLEEGGNITVSTQSGDITTEWLDSSSDSVVFLGNSGQGNRSSVTIVSTESGDIITEHHSFGNGGNITVSTQSGDIVTKWLDSAGEKNGGDIMVSTESGDITIERLHSFSFSSNGSSGNGGAISINAKTIKFNPPQYGNREKLAIRTFSVGTNESGNGGQVHITTNNFRNAEILTLSSQEKSGEVTIESQPQGNLELSNLSIITSKQVTIENPVNSQQPIKIDVGTQGQSGDVSIISSGKINLNNITIESDTKGNQPAGNVNITSVDTMVFDNSEIISTTNDEGNAGSITLETPQEIKFTNNSRLQADTQGTGKAGNINIESQTLNLDRGTSLTTETSAAGSPGEITIRANSIDIGENAQISATVTTDSSNTEGGGNININTNTLNISGILGIFAETAGEADAGTLTLNPNHNNSNLEINFTNNGFISASTSSTGNGGNIFIKAPETIDISGQGFIAVETSGIGNAGIIDIQTDNLTISNGVAISASTENKGNAGQININTTNFTLEKGTSLTTETFNQGQAGNIEINTRQLTIGEDAQISATAQKGATNTQAGGNIIINATDLLISGRLGIFAETAGESPAGTLTVNPYRNNPNLNITFTESGLISARTKSTGDGGNINILAPENINITGEGRITVETEGAGNAGTIKIETENLTIAENTTISATTSDSGDGGRININPTETFQLEGQILTETKGTGNGGTITINTGEMTAPNSTISAKSTNTGNAGTIDITAQGNITTGIITSEASQTTQNADGGNITITSFQGEINATQAIQSFSEKANAGDVTLTAQNDIKTDTISSHGQKQGGKITITSETGNIDTSNGEFFANYSGGGNAGNVQLEAPQGNITTNNIYSFADGNGGQISMKAGGDINLRENSNIISASEPPGEEGSRGVGRGGDIILEAGDNINTTTAEIYSGADIGDTGKIDVIAENAIETGEINLASGFVRDRVTVNNNFTLIPIPKEEAIQGVAGNITLRSNNSTIDTTAGIINSRSPDGTGKITLNARENITTGKLEASALNESKATRGGDVSIISQQGEINAIQAIETFSKQATAGNVTLTSPGSINLSSIHSEGMKEGGEITVNSEKGEIYSKGNIDSYSEEGRGGNVEINAPESVTLENVLSYGMTESGNLIIQSSQAQVETGNVETQAPAGSSGSIEINGTKVGTGNLRSIGKTSADAINVEATDGSINTYDIEIKSDGTIGSLTLQAREDINTGNIEQITGKRNAEVDINSGEDITIENINQLAEGDTLNVQIAEGDITIESINQVALNDAVNIQSTDGSIIIGSINQSAEGNITNIQSADNKIIVGGVNQGISEQFSDQVITMLEENRSQEYSDYFGEDFNEKLVNTQNVRDILTDMAAQTGTESAVVYINAYDDQIQIILFTKDGQPILKNVPTVNREKLWQNAIIFSGEITDKSNRQTTSYLPLAQKLYKWLIEPISAELEAANIDTILFSMDRGFRLLPLAALHDGEQFLIEKYSISLIPSVSLMDSRYNSVINTKLLGMGASQFTDKPSLPAVPIELQTISEKLWRGNIFLNEDFTKNNLINELENHLYPIVHLATHAEFRAGNANDSYIQLWNDKLRLDEVRKLRWNSKKAELLVLSACRTAVGDHNAELGFAGLAIATGVKSALGSFWLVSDEGTLGLMTEFYAHLNNVQIKAEALREAQLGMLRGEVAIEYGTLRGSGSRGEVNLPPELGNIENRNFAHPYYWAGFTMVGSPW